MFDMMAYITAAFSGFDGKVFTSRDGGVRWDEQR